MTMFTDEVVVRFFADTKGSEKAFGKLISVTRTLHKGVEKTTELVTVGATKESPIAGKNSSAFNR